VKANGHGTVKARAQHHATATPPMTKAGKVLPRV
jgi:hypothetical protein